MAHPATGPISPEQMRELANAPYGKAAEVLRQHDPLWGKLHHDADAPAAPIKWKVFVTQQVTMEAYAKVEALTEEDALEIVGTMRASEFSWDLSDTDTIEIQYAEPA